MRKLKLFFTACALLLCAGIQAQSWTVPTLTGEVPVSGNTYKLLNVGTGKFLTEGQAWFNWSTTAILANSGSDFTFTGNASSFTLTTHRSGNSQFFTSGNGIEGDAMHVDGWQGFTNYGYTQLPSGYYHIHDAGGNENSLCWGYNRSFHATGVVAHANANAEGWECDWVFLNDLNVIPLYLARLDLYNEYLKAAAEDINTDDAAVVYNNANATIDEINEAKATLKQARYEHALAVASNDNPRDITEWVLTNTDFSSGNIDGWETNYVSGQQAQNIGYQGMAYTNGNVSISQFIEVWVPDRTLGDGYLRQTVSGLPEGKYVLEADGISSWQSDGSRTVTGSQLYITADNIDYYTDMSTANGAPEHFSVQFLNTGEGDVLFGLRTINSNGNWLCADNFKVTFYGVDLSGYVSQLEFAVSEAAKVTEIPQAAKLALINVVNTYNKTWQSSQEYITAIQAIQSATTTALTLVPLYATWIEQKDEALALATGHESITGAIGKVAQYVETLTTVNDLTEANTMTTNMVANYTAWYELKNRADELVAVSNNNAEANATLQEAITTQYNNISTLAQEINNADITTSTGLLVTKALVNSLINTTIPNATSTLKEAMTTYVKTAEPTNDECFDLTFLIVNPHFTEGEGVTAIPTGWTLESGGITEHRLATHNFEAYHQQFNLSQTIPDLPKGTYKVTLQGFARHDGTDKDKTNLYCGIVNQPIKNISDEYSTTSLFHDPMEGTYCPLWSAVEINYDTEYTRDGQTVYQPNGMTGSYYWFQETNPLTEQPYYTNEVQTLITEDGDLKIGFKCETLTDWVIWDNFHLYYYGSAIAVTLDEATGTSYSEDIDNANVTLKKTIYQGWNTIVIPFEVEEISAFNCTDLYEFTGYDESTTTLIFNPVTAIEPNVPYLLKASAGITDAIIFNGVTVKAATDLTTGEGGFNFVGTYQEALVADGDYILGEKDGAAGFYRSSGGNKVKAYRAYMKRIAEDDGHFARIAISLNGETTAIDTINGQPIINNAAIYNLSGQQVKKAQKGIYIQNGKKVVIK